MIGSHRHVGHAQKPHAAGHADAADAGDRRLGGILRQPQQVRVIDIGPGEIHRERSAAVLQVGAGAKRLVASARQHDDADVLVVMRLAIAAGNPGDDVGIDGVPVGLPALLAYHAAGIGHDNPTLPYVKSGLSEFGRSHQG